MDKIILLISILMLSVTSCSNKLKLILESDYVDDKYEAGQVWKYKTRVNEKESRVQIVKIDKYQNQEPIIHVSVVGLKIPNSSSDSGMSETIGHIPITKKAFSDSVTVLDGVKPISSDFKDGYLEWKKSFEKGEAGVFSISIIEIVGVMDDVFNK